MHQNVLLLCTEIWKEVMKGIEKWESRDIGHFEGTTSKKSQNKEKRVLSNYKVILIIPKLWFIYGLYTITINYHLSNYQL